MPKPPPFTEAPPLLMPMADLHETLLQSDTTPELKELLRQALPALYARAGDLDDLGWQCLYLVVHRWLNGKYFPEYLSLQEAPEDYIALFFQERLFLPTYGEGTRKAPRYLTDLNHIYQYFLRDCRRRQIREGKDVTDLDNPKAESALQQPDPKQPEDDFTPLFDLGGLPDPDDAARVGPLLTAVGLSLEWVSASAAAFLAQRPAWVAQALAWLPDTADGTRHPPVQSFKSQVGGSPGAAFRKLGVVPDHKGHYQDFRRTEIGRWLSDDLQLSLAPDRMTQAQQRALAMSLKILCRQALQSTEPDDPKD